MLRRILFILLAVAIVAALAWALWPKPLAVETATLDRRSIAVTVDEEGTSRIRDVFTVSAPITGTLTRTALRAGDAVIANKTVLASISPLRPALLDARALRAAEAGEKAAEAAVDLAAAQLQQAQTQASFLQSELTRATQLAQTNTIPLQSVEKAKMDVAVAQSGVVSARANLVVREGELASARAALTADGVDDPAPVAVGSADGASTHVVPCCVDVEAPVSGDVLRVVTRSEQVVQAGTPLVEVGDPANLEIAVDLLSADAVRVTPEAEATIDGWGGPALRAKVTSIEPAAVTKVSALGIEEQRVSVVLALLDPPELRQRLGHGFRVVSHITVWKGDNLLAIPVAALFRRGTSWAAFSVKDGVAHLQPIELGQRNADYAEVTSGLESGAQVILHPSDQVADGSKVEILK